MNKHQADATARQMEAAGFTVKNLHKGGRGDWQVEGVDNRTGYDVIFVNVSTWQKVLAERGNGATPQSGAPLKYNEPTQQVSITVPVSVLAAADAGGRGKRSAWFVQAARAWMEREGAV